MIGVDALNSVCLPCSLRLDLSEENRIRFYTRYILKTRATRCYILNSFCLAARIVALRSTKRKQIEFNRNGIFSIYSADLFGCCCLLFASWLPVSLFREYFRVLCLSVDTIGYRAHGRRTTIYYYSFCRQPASYLVQYSLKEFTTRTYFC